MQSKDQTLLRAVLVGAIFWLTLAVPGPLSAQGDAPLPAPPPAGKNFRFEHLASQAGLPSLTVRSAVEDQQGFMWFATNNGLARYDGYTFKTFHNDPRDPRSLSIESLGTLYVDRQGTLWVGTWNGGLNVFDRNTEQFTRYVHDPDDPHSLSHNRVNAIFEDKSGRLWIGTDGGVNQFDPTTGQFIHYQHDPKDPGSLSDDTVKTIVEDAAGQLWVGTLGGGIDKFNPASGQFTHYLHDPNNPNSLIYDNVEVIAADAAGRLWIGTSAGLDHFDPATGLFTHYRHDPADPKSLSSDNIVALHLEPAGDMWIGTAGGGLNIFDPQTEAFAQVSFDPTNPDGFHGDWVSSIYADRSGALWFSTLSDGVNRLDRGAARFELYQNDPDDADSLSSGGIWSILRDHSGALWVASAGGGLNKLDPATGHFTHYRNDPADPASLSNDSIFAMTEDAAGYLWVGTIKGLNRYDPKSGKFTLYLHDSANPASLSENWVAGLYADRSGRLWVGTIGKGLDLYDPATDSFRHYQFDSANPRSLSDNNVLTFAEDASGKLWMGTISGGLNELDPETGTFTHYRHDPDDLNSLISDDVEQIYMDSAGVLWLATPAGLDKFDPRNGAATHYAEQQGLASKALASVVGDAQGNLWVGTQGSGLARFDPRSETFRNYDRSDGLQSDGFIPRGAYRDADGKLYFGGLNGLNAFYPDQLRDNAYIPPLVLTGFQIFNQAAPIGAKGSPLQRVINETDQITLSYRQSVFSFEFAALSYRAPTKNRYAYRLEGFDTDWNYVGSDRRFATYTNLNPGTYTFQVKASNNDGVWNETGKAVKITITPPWWRTWWFYTLVIGSVLGTGWLIYRAKNNQVKTLRAAALALQKSERNYREVFNATSDALFIHDEAGRVLDVNDRVCALFGYEREAALGLSLGDFSLGQPPYSRAEAGDWIRRAIEAGPQLFEWRSKGRDGGLFWTEVALHASEIAGEKRVIASARDITDRKQAEMLIQAQKEQLVAQNEELVAQNEELVVQGRALEQTEAELRELNAELEQRIAARTVELSQTNADLARVMRGKDEFLASLSHELRTPLTGILGMTETLEMSVYGPLSEPQLRAVRTVHESGEHLLSLINDVLDLARVEAGKLSLDLGPVAVKEVCQASLRLVYGQANRKQIKTQVQLDPAVMRLWADERRLKEMLVNLLSNAIKFTEAGGEVGLTVAGNAAHEEVQFTVWDTGIGLSAEQMARLFQPFVQVDNALTRASSGSGLGLALVRRMAELHGGRVAVESEGVPGKGSRFTIVLPWKLVSLAPEAKPAWSQPDSLASESATQGKLVLIADDVEAVREVMSGFLFRLGCRVAQARDGVEAWAMLRDLKPDLAFLDIQMPGLDGLEITRRVRADPELAQMPLIAMTALAMPGDHERCLAAGANDYLSKPINHAQVVTLVRQWLAAGNSIVVPGVTLQA